MVAVEIAAIYMLLHCLLMSFSVSVYVPLSLEMPLVQHTTIHSSIPICIYIIKRTHTPLRVHSERHSLCACSIHHIQRFILYKSRLDGMRSVLFQSHQHEERLSTMCSSRGYTHDMICLWVFLCLFTYLFFVFFSFFCNVSGICMFVCHPSLLMHLLRLVSEVGEDSHWLGIYLNPKIIKR